jgi:hypothetical protein
MKCDQTIQRTAVKGGFFGLVHELRTRTGLLTLVATLGMNVACGGSIDAGGEDPLGDTSEALKYPGDPFGPLPFKYWRQLNPLPNATGNPGLVSHYAHFFVAFSQVTNGRYWGSAVGNKIGDWAEYSTRTFASGPAVVALPNFGNGDGHLMVIGRGSGTADSSRRIFWSEAYQPREFEGFPASAPIAITSFAAVSGEFFSGVYGYPGATSTDAGEVVIAYVGPIGGGGVRVFAQYKGVNVPWSARVQGPALPVGWTPAGIPAVERGPFSIATIMVLGRNSSNQYQIFRCYFWANQTSGTFFDPFGPTEFDALPLPPNSPAIESSPGLEWDDQLNTHTVYYRSGNSIYQASINYDLWEEMPKKVEAAPNPSFASAPSANGNYPYEGGSHLVLARDSANAIWFAESFQNADLVP